MRVDFDVAMEVAAHEALVRQTYKDSKGVLTWCVGMTSATGHRVERYIGKPQSVQHSMNLHAWALTSYARQVQDAFKARPLTQAQFAAALHWNTGATKRASVMDFILVARRRRDGEQGIPELDHTEGNRHAAQWPAPAGWSGFSLNA